MKKNIIIGTLIAIVLILSIMLFSVKNKKMGYYNWTPLYKYKPNIEFKVDNVKKFEGKKTVILSLKLIGHVYTDEEIRYSRKEDKDKIAYLLQRIEIDCNEYKSMQSSFVPFDSEGNYINVYKLVKNHKGSYSKHYLDFSMNLWKRYISPQSHEEALYKKVCK